MQSFIVVLLGLLVNLQSFCTAVTIKQRAQSVDFQDPPNQYRPKFRYWLPDASVPVEVVTNDVADIKSVGAGGLEYLPFYLYGLPGPGTPDTVTPTDWTKYGFGTPASTTLFKAVLQKAQEVDVLVDFAVGPNQGAGVPAVPGTPGLSFELLLGNTSIAGGQHFTGSVPAAQQPSAALLSGLGFQGALEQFGSPTLLAVTAFQVVADSVQNVSIPLQNSSEPIPTIALNESTFVDLSHLVVDGQLDWTAPEGSSTWRIFSFWEHYTNQRANSPGTYATDFIGNGSWTVDHFSATGAEVVTDFWDTYILNDTELAGLVKAVGNYAWEDSMEILASLYWTPGFLDQFQQDNGYSLVKYLPLLFSLTNSWNGFVLAYPEQFSFGNYTIEGTSIHNLDYRTTLNKGYQAYVNQFESWAHNKGLHYSNQPAYNLPLQMLSDIPLIDTPECESLGFSDDVDAYRQFSGPAHLYSKQVISNELGAVNTAAYSLTLPELLFHTKRAWSGGVSMVVYHGSPYSGNYPNTTWPGYTTFNYMFTDMWNRIQPCWQHMKDMLDYVGRTQFILQQGVPQIDLAFYLYETPYTPVHQYPSDNLQNLGYTYEYLGPDNLLGAQAFVKNAVLAPDGPAYKALIISSAASVVASQNVITVDAAKKIVQFAAAGLPVMILGNLPNITIPDLVQQPQLLNTVLQELLSTPNVYQIASINDIPTVLASAGVSPRISLACSSNPVFPVWRSDAAAGIDYVFFYNDNPTASSCTVNLTVSSGTQPYTYDAWTGTQQPVLQYSRTLSGISVPLQLTSNQTVLIGLQSNTNSSVPECPIREVSENVALLGLSEDGGIFAHLLGPATITSSSGQNWSFTAIPPPASTLQSWNISIEDWHAPEDRFLVETAVTIHNFTNQALAPWSDLGAGMEAVSGVARYTTVLTTPEISMETPALGALLSVGPIQHSIRIEISGQALPPIDLLNSRIDISNYIEPGENYTLMIEVTSTLFNRIKATANSTMIWGHVAGVEQPLYNVLPYKEYGLVGPVSVQWTNKQSLVDDGSC